MPTVTGTVDGPVAAGVPVAVNVTVCVPVEEKAPVTLKVTPFTAVVVIEYEPIVVTFAWMVAVLRVVVGVPTV